MAETASLPAMEELPPRADNHCFGCGGANARGLQLTFQLDREGRRVLGRFALDADLQGSGGMLHGGIIALLLDEAMGKLTRLRGVRAVTAELNVEYLRPIPTGEEIRIEAREESDDGRNLHYLAEITRADGKPLARGRGRFVAIAARD